MAPGVEDQASGGLQMVGEPLFARRQAGLATSRVRSIRLPGRAASTSVSRPLAMAVWAPTWAAALCSQHLGNHAAFADRRAGTPAMPSRASSPARLRG